MRFSRRTPNACSAGLPASWSDGRLAGRPPVPDYRDPKPGIKNISLAETISSRSICLSAEAHRLVGGFSLSIMGQRWGYLGHTEMSESEIKGAKRWAAILLETVKKADFGLGPGQNYSIRVHGFSHRLVILLYMNTILNAA